MKTISIVTPCFNEVATVEMLVASVSGVMAEFPSYNYEHIFIDNHSTDGTAQKLKNMAQADRRLKVIINVRDFGYLRSPYYGLLQARGDAVIMMAADFQDPPELIKEFIHLWEKGHRIVTGIKTASEENRLVYFGRAVFYKVLRMFSRVDLLEQFTGFGLYDRQVIETLRTLKDPYPYFRGLISEVGSEIKQVTFIQPKRKQGKTKSSFFVLFEVAMLGLTQYSRVPLRITLLFGFLCAGLTFLVGIGYLVAKLLFWNTFTAGMAPMLIGLCFLGSVQLLSLGVIGEYVGAIFTYVQNRPLVIEQERINFDDAGKSEMR